MQFNILALTVAAMAAVASAQEAVTVYACNSGAASPTGVAPSGVATPTAGPTAGTTGGVTPAGPTGSPIPYVASGASANGVSALGLIVAGGVALFL